MNNIDRFSEEEISCLYEILSDYDLGHRIHAEKIMEDMPGSLIGIAIDYSFNDTEVREWIHTYVKEIM